MLVLTLQALEKKVQKTRLNLISISELDCYEVALSIFESIESSISRGIPYCIFKIRNFLLIGFILFMDLNNEEKKRENTFCSNN